MADEAGQVDERRGVTVTLAEVRALARYTEYPDGGLIQWSTGDWLSRDDVERLVLSKLRQAGQAAGDDQATRG